MKTSVHQNICFNKVVSLLRWDRLLIWLKSPEAVLQSTANISISGIVSIDNCRSINDFPIT